MTKEQKDNSNKPVKDDNLKNLKKFNFNWIYLIVAVLLLSALFFNPDYSKESSWMEVQQMLIDQDVSKIEIVKKRTFSSVVQSDFRARVVGSNLSEHTRVLPLVRLRKLYARRLTSWCSIQRRWVKTKIGKPSYSTSLHSFPAP